MFYLTKDEKMFVLVLASVFLTGITLNYAFKKHPKLKDIVNIVESRRLYPKINLNTATAEELIQLPYIGEYTANNIVSYRQNSGPFQTIEEVKKVKGIRDKNYERFYPYLTVQ